MWLLGLVLLLTSGQLVYSTDYCSIKCMNDVPHTMCQYKASPSSNCQGYESRKLSEDDVKSIVNQHNKLRSKVAIGKEQGQPSAANMLQLVGSYRP
ncbi:unnamed protein product [Timema podura]|uniref:Uncharacterized protein n=1 Tax=Timema podura TaxID=61482 RepID=A0ABN7PHS2_TIMPD|nr:unnamed protein product [Timema podura]